MISFFRKKTPKWNKAIQAKWEPVFMFEIGGKQYFGYDSFLKHTPERADWVAIFQEELSMKCTREFLLHHTKAVDEALNKGKLTLVADLNKMLTDRLEYVSDPEIIYKLASVLFFEKDEDPTVYDQEYNEKKIADWKKYKLKDFFLRLPWKVLIPGMDISEEDLQSFIIANKAVRKITSIHLKDILQLLSNSDLTQKQLSDLQLQISSLEELVSLNE